MYNIYSYSANHALALLESSTAAEESHKENEPSDPYTGVGRIVNAFLGVLVRVHVEEGEEVGVGLVVE